MILFFKKTPHIVYLLLFISIIQPVWSRSNDKQAVLAVLTLNVASFTSWPENTGDNASSVLNLCVFGDNVVQQAFEKIDNNVVNDKTIHIINLSRLRALKQCQVIYLSELSRKRLIPLLVEIEGQPILTVGGNMEFLRGGGMVGLEKINGKIQITFNLPMINRSNLVINSRLLKLAKIVEFPTSTY